MAETVPIIASACLRLCGVDDDLTARAHEAALGALAQG